MNHHTFHTLGKRKRFCQQQQRGTKNQRGFQKKRGVQYFVEMLKKTRVKEAQVEKVSDMER